MAYTRITAQRVIDRVRSVLNQVPFTSEKTQLQSNLIGGPTTRFSDTELIVYINRAVRAIVATSKACHVYEAIQKETSAGNAASTTIKDPANPLLRLLRSRTHADVYRARLRSVDAHRRLAASGAAPTATAPVFTFEDGEVNIYPVTALGVDKSFSYHYVTVPTEVTAAGDALPIDERFEAAIIYYVAAMCYQKLRRTDLYDFAWQVYTDEIEPYRLEVRTKLVNDDEVSVE